MKICQISYAIHVCARTIVRTYSQICCCFLCDSAFCLASTWLYVFAQNALSSCESITLLYEYFGIHSIFGKCFFFVVDINSHAHTLTHTPPISLHVVSSSSVDLLSCCDFFIKMFCCYSTNDSMFQTCWFTLGLTILHTQNSHKESLKVTCFISIETNSLLHAHFFLLPLFA